MRGDSRRSVIARPEVNVTPEPMKKSVRAPFGQLDRFDSPASQGRYADFFAKRKKWNGSWVSPLYRINNICASESKTSIGKRIQVSNELLTRGSTAFAPQSGAVISAGQHCSQQLKYTKEATRQDGHLVPLELGTQCIVASRGAPVLGLRHKTSANQLNNRME